MHCRCCENTGVRRRQAKRTALGDGDETERSIACVAGVARRDHPLIVKAPSRYRQQLSLAPCIHPITVHRPFSLSTTSCLPALHCHPAPRSKPVRPSGSPELHNAARCSRPVLCSCVCNSPHPYYPICPQRLVGTTRACSITTTPTSLLRTFDLHRLPA